MLIFGGFIAGVNTNSLVAYDFRRQAWTEVVKRGDWPCPRNGHSACVYQGSMYVFGGRTFENKKLNDLWKFDLNQQNWTVIFPQSSASEQIETREQPLERSGHSCAVFG